MTTCAMKTSTRWRATWNTDMEAYATRHSTAGTAGYQMLRACIKSLSSWGRPRVRAMFASAGKLQHTSHCHPGADRGSALCWPRQGNYNTQVTVILGQTEGPRYVRLGRETTAHKSLSSWGRPRVRAMFASAGKLQHTSHCHPGADRGSALCSPRQGNYNTQVTVILGQTEGPRYVRLGRETTTHKSLSSWGRPRSALCWPRQGNYNTQVTVILGQTDGPRYVGLGRETTTHKSLSSWGRPRVRAVFASAGKLQHTSHCHPGADRGPRYVRLGRETTTHKSLSSWGRPRSALCSPRQGNYNTQVTVILGQTEGPSYVRLGRETTTHKSLSSWGRPRVRAVFASAGKLQHTSHCHPEADRGSALCWPRQGNYSTQVTVILGQTEGPRYVRLGRETTTHKSLSSWGRPRVRAMFASAGKLQHTSHCHPGADRGSALCWPRQGNYNTQVTVILGQTEGPRYVGLGRETTTHKSLSSWGRPRVRAMFASAGKLQHTSHCHPGADRGSALCWPRQGNYNTQVTVILGQTEGPSYVRLGRETTTHKSLSSWGRPRSALCSPRQGNYNTQVTVILGQTEGPRCVRLGRETTTHKSLSSWGRPRVRAMFASAGKLQHTSHCHRGADRGSALCWPRQGNYNTQVTVILGQTEGPRYVRLGRETTTHKSLSSWGRPRVRAMFASAGKLQHTSHCHPGADRGSALCSPRQGNYNTQVTVILGQTEGPSYVRLSRETTTHKSLSSWGRPRVRAMFASAGKLQHTSHCHRGADRGSELCSPRQGNYNTQVTVILGQTEGPRYVRLGRETTTHKSLSSWGRPRVRAMFASAGKLQHTSHCHPGADRGSALCSPRQGNYNTQVTVIVGQTEVRAMFASAGKLQHTSHCHPGADRGSALCWPRQGNYNTQVTVILGQTEGPRYVGLGRETTTHKSLSSWGRPRSALCSPRQGNYNTQVTVILGQTEGPRYVGLGRETTTHKSLSS